MRRSPARSRSCRSSGGAKCDDPPSGYRGHPARLAPGRAPAHRTSRDWGRGHPGAAQSAASSTTPQDPEADRDRPAAVELGGVPVVWITAGAGPYSTEFRADRISQRLKGIVRDRTIPDPTVTVTEADDSSELRVGTPPADGRHPAGCPQPGRGARRRLRSSTLASWRRPSAPSGCATRRQRSSVHASTAVIATLVLCLVVWRDSAGGALDQSSHRTASRQPAGSLRVHSRRRLLAPGHLGRAVDRSLRAVRLILILVSIDLYLPLRPRAVSLDARECRSSCSTTC